MKKSKLFQLYRTFTESELRALKKFIASPFNNQREDVLQLFLLLRKTKNLEQLTYPFVFEQLYPQQVYQEQAVRYVMSYLLKIIEEFLVWKELEADQVQKTFYLAKAYRKRKLELPFLQNMKKTEQKLEASGLKNPTYYWQKNQLIAEHYDFTKDDERSNEMNLQALSDSLDLCYISQKLYQSCILKTHEKFIEKKYDYGLLGNVLEYLDYPARTKLLNQPAIGVYHPSYMLVAEKDTLYFNQLKEVLPQQEQYLTKEQLRDIYIIAINYGIKEVNLGKTPFIRITFELYQKMCEKELFNIENMISQGSYRNVIVLGSNLKAYDWLEFFIKNYTQYLDHKEKEHNHHYQLARLHFAKKEYADTLGELQRVNFKDNLSDLTARWLQLKTLYELEAFEVLENYIKNFEQLVLRRKIKSYHRTSYVNTVRMIKKIMAHGFLTKTQKRELHDEIERAQMTDKKWLQEKLENH